MAHVDQPAEPTVLRVISPDGTPNLHGNEGNFDPQHISYLHRFLRSSADDVRNTYHARDAAPIIDPVETDFRTHLCGRRARLACPQNPRQPEAQK